MDQTPFNRTRMKVLPRELGGRGGVCGFQDSKILNPNPSESLQNRSRLVMGPSGFRPNTRASGKKQVAGRARDCKFRHEPEELVAHGVKVVLKARRPPAPRSQRSGRWICLYGGCHRDVPADVDDHRIVNEGKGCCRPVFDVTQFVQEPSEKRLRITRDRSSPLFAD